MNKFKKHRREITKKFHIRGYEKYVSVMGDSAMLGSSAGILRKLKITGKSEQIQCSGCNIFNIDSITFNYRNPANSPLFVFEKGSDSFQLTFNHTAGTATAYIANTNNLNLKPNTKYTSKCIVTFKNNGSAGLSQAGSMGCSFLCQDTADWGNKKFYIVNSYVVTNGTKEGTFEIFTNFTTPADLTEYKYITTRVASLTSVIYEKLMIVEGNYTKDNFPEYEPYTGGVFSPSNDMPQEIAKNEKTIVTVNEHDSNEKTAIFDKDLVLCGFDGINDTLSLDFANNTAKLEKKINYVSLADLIPGCCTVNQAGDSYYAEIIRLKRWQENTKAYCTHCKQYTVEGYSPNEMCFELVNDEYQTVLYLYDIPVTSAEELFSYATENNIMLAYALENEEISLKSYNLPKEALPCGVDVVIEAKGSKQIDAIYYSLNQ